MFISLSGVELLLIESGAAKLAATMIEVGGLNEWHRLGGDFGKLKSHGSLTLVSAPNVALYGALA